ncbi:Lrp/AsnC family transcriptional regulator [Massilia sp. TW-1]|uniref:Lrp/AsnC family transcriptional regulator n=1 Tax=Telluria antibiotica TaxID=2717319 RepID=A0ABX0PHB2_9BURK|nr:Lrp/AsnC family transcriptional regulator [Telluria antibiotica]NIA56841.1 Lrp/AsnC family transcriptional regulator [Telluria antibiotica]
MDDYDRKILAELQKDGRLSLTDLGERIGLSLSPCHRRVRALEDAGIIADYRATIDPAAVGLNFAAIVFVSLKATDRDSVRTFEESVPSVPEIIQAQRLFGDPDYILNIVTTDVAAFQKLYDDSLSTLPNVLRLRSTLVMKSIVHSRPLPF